MRIHRGVQEVQVKEVLQEHGVGWGGCMGGHRGAQSCDRVVMKIREIAWEVCKVCKIRSLK